MILSCDEVTKNNKIITAQPIIKNRRKPDLRQTLLVPVLMVEMGSSIYGRNDIYYLSIFGFRSVLALRPANLAQALYAVTVHTVNKPVMLAH